MKKLVKSNGSPNTHKEVYGAKVQLPAPVSISAASIRSKTLSNRPSKEIKKPGRRYDVGNCVYITLGKLPFTNGRIVGYEWGGDNKDIMKDEWVYYVVDIGKPDGSMQTFMIAESQITDRISL